MKFLKFKQKSSELIIHNSSFRIHNSFDICIIALIDIKTDARILNFAHTLSKFGKRVCIIAYGNHADAIQFEMENIKFIPIEPSNKVKAYQRWFKFYQKAIYFKSIKAKIYLAGDLYSLPLAVSFAKHKNSKVIYDSREIFSALGPLSGKKLKQKILSLIELHYIKHVNEVIVSGELDGEYLKDYFPKQFSYKLIMNLPPYSGKIESNKLRDKFNIPNDTPLLLYQGVLLPGRGLLPVIDSLLFYTEANLIIIGDGPFINELKSIVKQKNLTSKVIFAGKIPYEELPEWTASADIGINFIEPVTLSYQFALPNKLFEYIMARIPVLSSDLPAIRKIYEKYHIGELISPDSDSQKIAQTLKFIFQNKANYLQACNDAAQNLSYQSQELKILELINSL